MQKPAFHLDQKDSLATKPSRDRRLRCRPPRFSLPRLSPSRNYNSQKECHNQGLQGRPTRRIAESTKRRLGGASCSLGAVKISCACPAACSIRLLANLSPPMSVMRRSPRVSTRPALTDGRKSRFLGACPNPGRARSGRRLGEFPARQRRKSRRQVGRYGLMGGASSVNTVNLVR
jgi:hypothetical protein